LRDQDPLSCMTLRVGESNLLPPGQDLLLDTLVRLTEMVVNLKVDGTSELVEGRLRVGLKQMVQSKIEGVRNEKDNLMVLKGFCVELKHGLFIFCGWLVTRSAGCTLLDFDNP
jgi:hypothetical protein